MVVVVPAPWEFLQPAGPVLDRSGCAVRASEGSMEPTRTVSLTEVGAYRVREDGMETIAERQYLSPSTETIAVKADESGTAHLVNYNIDNGAETGTLHKGQQLNIEVSPNKPSRVLTILFTFSGTGGQYDVKLTGSLGGGDTDTVEQGDFDVPAESTEYLFQLKQ